MPKSDATLTCLRICLVANILLAAVKLFAGIVGHSRALIADAINSLLDIVSSAVAWFGYRFSLRPADESHPYGHGNADVLAALFVGLVIFGTGIFVAEEAFSALRGEQPELPTLLPVFVACGVILTKIILYFYTARVARQSRSPVVEASAADHKSDVLATGGALVGILLARAGWPLFDPIAALWVAVLIIYHAVRILFDNVHILMAGRPRSTRLEPMIATLVEDPDVKGVHRSRARTQGSRIVVYAEILVEGTLSVRHGHDVAKRARRRMMERHPELLEVEIHVEPMEPGRAANAEVKKDQ